MDEAHEWYWDLVANVAVRADERGPGDQVLGPYPTREAAENWKRRVDARNEQWEAADEAWDDADASHSASHDRTGGDAGERSPG